MDSLAPQERRRYSRVGFEADATISQGSNQFPVHLLDISIKGALVKLEPTQAVGDQPATLTIDLENGSQIIMQLTLVHQHEHYLGFHCESIDLESAAHLRRLIELNLAAPDAAERVLDEMLYQAPESSNPGD